MAKPQVVKEAMRRFVPVKALNRKDDCHSAAGSGFVLKTGVVVTCSHVRGYGTEYLVSGSPARILDNGADSEGIDLILLACDTPEMPPLAFAERPKPMDPVFWYGGDFAGKGPVFVDGAISRIEDAAILTTAMAVGGASGALLWHHNQLKPLGVISEFDDEDALRLGFAIPGRRVNGYLRSAFKRLRYTGNPRLPF